MRMSAAAALALACVAALPCAAGAGIVSPRAGGTLPERYLELKRGSKEAFTFAHAWIERRARQVRGDLRYRPALASGAGSVLRAPSRALGGKLAIPVVLGLYSDITEPPFTRGAFDMEFFTGPWPTGTMRQYWSEVSYNLLDLTGTVFDWVPLSQNEYYYTGGVGYWGLVPGVSHTGDMIKEIADALDPTVDFGQFDNDGPDGIPNSGDDDGFVDVLLVIHPTAGAECDEAAHMWSHSWRYSAWPVSGGEPYATNDPAAGGGFVRIDDYIIAPSYSCGTGQIEIGVVCHELGHALGLPDLYDSSGNSHGIGYWGLMGAGNWNTPASPAHLCVWSREQLGWANPVEIDWHARGVTLDPIETSGDVLKMPLPTRRFRRLEYVQGSRALVVGCTLAEAQARRWPGGAGYGNDWNESMFHDFTVNGDRPVSVSFTGYIDAEDGYDFGRLLLEIGGATDTLGVYTGGPTSIGGTIDIGGRLPAGPCDFTLRFEFTSDVSFSDEDGYYDSHPGYSFNVDNVRVQGGGLDDASDFELDSGAWRNGSPAAEYFLVANRRKSGFDANLLGEGMLIWHAENSIAYSLLGNTGGARDNEPRGLVLQEADGDSSLLIPTYLGGNGGDAGDPFPGTRNNRSFGSGTVPRSWSNNGVSTPVSVTGISLGATTVTATVKGGMPAPSVQSVIPDTIDIEHDAAAMLDIRGSWMLYGAAAYLSLGADTVRPDSVEWRGEERIVASFPVELLFGGAWDLTVVSGDGQAATKAGALFVESVYLSAGVTVGRDYLLAAWKLESSPEIRGCLLYRSADGGAFTPVSPDTLRSSSGAFSFQDFSARPGTPYSYKIVTFLNGGAEAIYVLAGPFSVPRVPFTVDQNYPNPFTVATTVSFFNPSSRVVSIDVYDISGRRVERLASRRFERGTHELPWTPASRGTAAGVYFCVFRTPGETKTIKLIYMP
jgi:M6 family metalloprotease-like protein